MPARDHKEASAREGEADFVKDGGTVLQHSEQELVGEAHEALVHHRRMDIGALNPLVQCWACTSDSQISDSDGVEVEYTWETVLSGTPRPTSASNETTRRLQGTLALSG